MREIKPLSDFISADEFLSQFEYKPNSPSSSPPLSTPPLRYLPYAKTLQRRKRDEEKNGSGNRKNESRKRKRGSGKAPSLTADQRRSEPYRRVHEDHAWVPPTSPHNLIQESYHDDPWKVLVICLLCNRTRGSQARKIIDELFWLCPSAEKAVEVDVFEIKQIIRKLGLQSKRSCSIKRLSMEYLQDWAYVTELHTVGKYAADAYAIFCSGHWRDVSPVDHKLVDYWKFLHQNENLCHQQNQADAGVDVDVGVDAGVDVNVGVDAGVDADAQNAAEVPNETVSNALDQIMLDNNISYRAEMKKALLRLEPEKIKDLEKKLTSHYALQLTAAMEFNDLKNDIIMALTGYI